MFEISKIAYDLYVQNWIDENTTPELRLQNIRKYYSYVRECLVDEIEPDIYKDWLSEYGFNGSLCVCYEEFCDMEYHDKDYIRYLLGEDNELIEMYYQDIEDYLEEEALSCENSVEKENKYFEARLVNYDENNVPYNVETVYFSAVEQIEKQDIAQFCREDLGLDFEEVFSVEEIPYEEALEYVKDADIPILNTDRSFNDNKYAMTKEVDLENFKNALECIDYNPEDYTEEELLEMVDSLSDKLANDDTYNAIYNEALEEVLKEYEQAKETNFEKTIDKAIADAEAKSKQEETNEKSDIDLEI